MKEESDTPAKNHFAFAFKGTFKVLGRCPTCSSIENEVSGQADWVCDDLDFLVRVLRDELDDLIPKLEQKINEGDSNSDGDVR